MGRRAALGLISEGTTTRAVLLFAVSRERCTAREVSGGFRSFRQRAWWGLACRPTMHRAEPPVGERASNITVVTLRVNYGFVRRFVIPRLCSHIGASRCWFFIASPL